MNHVASGTAHSAAAGIEPLLISIAMMAIGSLLAFDLFGFVSMFGAPERKRVVFSENTGDVPDPWRRRTR